jgi:hypothetical protein
MVVPFSTQRFLECELKPTVSNFATNRTHLKLLQHMTELIEYKLKINRKKKNRDALPSRSFPSFGFSTLRASQFLSIPI